MAVSTSVAAFLQSKLVATEAADNAVPMQVAKAKMIELVFIADWTGVGRGIVMGAPGIK
jgi:hypothetical protein